MSYLPIILGVGRPLGALDAQFHQPPLGEEDYRALKEKIFERDKHTCQCCGFQSEKYQDVLHKNFYVHDYRPDNLVTVCNFCHQTFHLDRAAQMRSGVLIWLPEIGQAALNHIMRAIYVARITQGTMADAAKSALDMLMARREEAQKRIGTDDPAVVAMIFRDFLEGPEYKYRDQKLKGIRLLPLDRRIIKEGDLEFNQFPQILAFWRSKKGPFGSVLPKSWPAMFEVARATLEENEQKQQPAAS